MTVSLSDQGCAIVLQHERLTCSAQVPAVGLTQSDMPAVFSVTVPVCTCAQA